MLHKNIKATINISNTYRLSTGGGSWSK